METGKLTETFRDRTVSVIKQNELSAGDHSESLKSGT